MRACAALVCALAVVACGGGSAPKVASPALAGWYVRDVAGGREVIDLRPNGDYLHVVTLHGATVQTDTARWHDSGDSAVTLDAFRARADTTRGAARADSVRARVHAVADGDLRIEIPPDTASFARRLRYVPTRGG